MSADREERRASPVGDTGSVPSGTMLTVPSAATSGPSGTAPIVAVNNVHWYSDPAFLSAAGGALLAISDPIIEALTSTGPFRWRPLVIGCVLALVAYLRKTTNSVLR
jgi:hypothetical protein